MNDFFHLEEYSISYCGPKRPLEAIPVLPHLLYTLASLAFSCSLYTPISFDAKEALPGQRP